MTMVRFAKRTKKLLLIVLFFVTPLVAQFQLPFYDDFSDGSDSDWTWYTAIGPTPAGQPWHGVVNGSEMIVTHDQNATLLTNGLSNLSNYTLEADVKITEILDDAYGGIFVRVYSHGGVAPGHSYYGLDICRRCSRWRLTAGYPDGTSEVLAQGNMTVSLNNWYRVKLSVKGDTVSAYLDGQLLGRGVPSQPLSGGYFGFGGSDDIILIDNVYVYSTTDIMESPTLAIRNKISLIKNVIQYSDQSLNLLSDLDMAGKAEFYKFNGQKVSEYSINLTKGLNQIPLPFRTLKENGCGNYFLVIRNNRSNVIASLPFIFIE